MLADESMGLWAGGWGLDGVFVDYSYKYSENKSQKNLKQTLKTANFGNVLAHNLG